ncbi:MAG: gluconeogenesis factor YvcK family protein, partial [Bacillota bacterium]
MNFWKWFYPGLGFKRWLFLIILGLIMISSGIALLFDFQIVGFIEQMAFRLVFFLTGHLSRYLDIIAGVILLTMGLIVICLSLNKLSGRVSQELLTDEELVDVFYQKKVLGKGPSIVAIGGGTGLSNLLRGLKNYTRNITAIVTVADDGGSSGKLRDELGILPPGDIRNCLVALADTEPLMEKLFQYRFSTEGHLVGHSFGNLFIASLTEVLGDFEAAVKESSKVLAIKGQVLPATNENVRLGAVYQDNTRKLGESAIP